MPSPLINVYIPTYNPKPEHLRAALDSLLAQTFADWTALIHDDPSGTDVRAIIEPSLKDPRITFKQSNKRLGIGGNWNACLPYGDAPFVQYLFQDDLWHPEYLETSIQTLQTDETLSFTTAYHLYQTNDDTEAGGEYVNVQRLKREMLTPGKHDGKAFLMQWMNRALRPNVIGEPSFVLMRRSAMQSAGTFAQDMRQGLDVEYWTRLLRTGNMYVIDKSLGAFRVHDAGASAINDHLRQGMFDRFRCMQNVIAGLPLGPDKRMAIRARDESLQEMIGRFFAGRQAAKGQVKAKSGAKVNMMEGLQWKDYPVLIQALIKYWFRE